MSTEKIQTLIDYLLLSTGAAGVATVTFWQNLDLGLALLLKFISLATFVCYLLINQDDIEKGYIKRKNKIKDYLKKYIKSNGSI